MIAGDVSGPAKALSRFDFKAPPGPEYKSPMGFRQNRNVLKEIESLDAKEDCQRIVYLMVAYDFEHEIQMGLDYMYFGSGADFDTAEVVGRGDFMTNGMKRLDDTKLLIYSFLQCGWDIDQGARAIEQMNKIHEAYSIKPPKFTKALYASIVAPMAFVELFGWRTLTQKEKDAWFYYWIGVGKRMGIKNLPESFDRAKQWMLDFHANKSNDISQFSKDLGRVNFEVMQKRIRWYLKPFGRWYLRTLMPPYVCAAYEVKELPMIAKLPVVLAIKMDALRRRFVRFGAYPFVIQNDERMVTYPDGPPTIEDAGPTKIVERIHAGVSTVGMRAERS